MPETRTTCHHCGETCPGDAPQADGHHFCCNGCLTVYRMLTEAGMERYYDMDSSERVSAGAPASRYAALDDPELAERFLVFAEGTLATARFYLPGIHCSSCIWVLEHLSRLNPEIRSSQVDFPKKELRVTFRSNDLSVRGLAELLDRIGYPPHVAMDLREEGERPVHDRRALTRLGLAGFAFGNVMLLSFPEYFAEEGVWLERYSPVFRWLMFAFSLPVVTYASQDYLRSAYKGLRAGLMNIDVPIALGILTLFLRSAVDVALDQGPGFFDSLTGLVFFLLLGRFFQQRTYAHLAFDRDYRSHFPIGVTRLGSEGEQTVAVEKVEVGDRILVRSGEVLPVDGFLRSETAWIDYSFVTGESEPVAKVAGDPVFAGGRQLTGVIEVEVVQPVSQAHLTQLWGNPVFRKDKNTTFQGLTDRIARNFTWVILAIAALATAYHALYSGWAIALNVMTAVFIIACPCALALAAPFTWGHILRIFGRHGLFLKNAQALERLAGIDHIVFDKTGTLTTGGRVQVTYQGEPFDPEEGTRLRSTLRASNHPLSRSLYELLEPFGIETLEAFEETTGSGIKGSVSGHCIEVGSAAFVEGPEEAGGATTVHVRIDGRYKGRYVFKHEYRRGLGRLVATLARRFGLSVMTGDHAGERGRLEAFFPPTVPLHFRQRPEDKLERVAGLQRAGHRVLMLGDGLNDAGAFAQSDVGMAISDNLNVFSPACDAILDARGFDRLDRYLALSRNGLRIIRWCFAFSFVYNAIGLAFAVTGNLEPVVAAILMPLSSLSVVGFTALASARAGRRWLGKSTT